MNNLQKNTRTPAAGVGQRGRRALVAIVAASLVCAWSAPATSAGFDVLGLQPGIRAGGSLARLSLSTKPDGVDNRWQPGFVVGATLAYDELPGVGLELQVLYSEQGGELEGSIELFGDTLDGQAKIMMAYLVIPLLASVKATGVTVRPYAKLGPQVGFRISSKAELSPVSGTSVETDIKEETNSVDFSLYFAAGLEFPLTTVSAHLEVGYSIGFTNLFKEAADVTDLVQGKNHVLGITAGLSY
jgi:hypothetical protein